MEDLIMNNEKTYLEMLNELYEMIETDNIPKNDKDRIIIMIKGLHEILWKYSA